MRANVRERNQDAFSGQLTPIMLINAIQHNGHFGIAAATRVATPESPTLLDLCFRDK
jgi:hypothetical protein